jgi:hypothetical protein
MRRKQADSAHVHQGGQRGETDSQLRFLLSTLLAISVCMSRSLTDIFVGLSLH